MIITDWLTVSAHADLAATSAHEVMTMIAQVLCDIETLVRLIWNVTVRQVKAYGSLRGKVPKLKAAGRPATSISGVNDGLPGSGTDFTGHVQRQYWPITCKVKECLAADLLQHANAMQSVTTKILLTKQIKSAHRKYR